MPRIRSIKPEFWQDTRMARLAALERLVFICLWSMADDEGRLEGDAETVRRFGSFREDSREVASALATLANLSRIVVYEVDGNPYIAIAHFNRHQKIDKPSASKLPDPSKGCALFGEDSRAFSEPSRKVAQDQGSGIRDHGSGKKVGGKPPTTPRLGVAELVGLGVDAQHAADWLRNRKEKRLPFTQTVLDDLKAQAQLAGLSVADAVKRAAAEGWGGFKAKWLTDSARTAAAPVSKQAALEARNASHAREFARRIREQADAAEAQGQ